MKQTFILLLLTLSTMAFSQDDEVFTLVSDTASPKMEMEKYYAHLGTIIKYPKQARKAGISGKVYVEFIIDKKGKVTAAKVVKGIGAGCDQEALNAIKNAGDWNPGSHNGKVVKQKIVMPIAFSLDDKGDKK